MRDGEKWSGQLLIQSKVRLKRRKYGIIIMIEMREDAESF